MSSLTGTEAEAIEVELAGEGADRTRVGAHMAIAVSVTMFRSVGVQRRGERRVWGEPEYAALSIMKEVLEG